ncbi:MAG: thiamine pyrophosphate-binding protein [Prevotellaceae bacterium]|jgi:acetolactate synthase-1/2/3 large subunit|nr:thiamine pyrophosphate-binding protein [Prevotellaceae bacterium]
MKVADYIVDFLIKKGVTDVFGIPGEVVLDFIDALNNRKNEISVHLNYHEQASAFAACGYAQASNNLCVAYSTKGPGLTNMITSIVDSFCDSIPVLFLTAHSIFNETKMRFEHNQEFDTIQMLLNTTKYAVRITKVENVIREFEYAYIQSVSGRKGPVFIDIKADILKADIDVNLFNFYRYENPIFDPCVKIVDYIKTSLRIAKRPVLLIGDGIHQSSTENYLQNFVNNIKMPVISSRFSQDLLTCSPYYFGFVGSHGTRYSNFILSKCDLIIAIGNRLSYNAKSESFAGITKQTQIIRVDIDENEFIRRQANCTNFHSDLKVLMPMLAKEDWGNIIDNNWIEVCNVLKKELFNMDINYPINIISSILKNTDNNWIVTSDVGNNEFWLSRAYAFAAKPNRILFSKSFGALGCSLPKAIGAYYHSKNRILCFSGDQGLQMNLQELQYISHEKIPITVIILNNFSSGMIRSKQECNFNSRFVHTTLNSGYSTPDFCAIAKAYSIPYYAIKNENDKDLNICINLEGPEIIEVFINETVDVLPKLPKGCLCQDFYPFLERYIFNCLNEL